ncbi:FAD-dependent tricarballylate dehydrogenase TcuA [Kocuria sp. TGY1127_2]|uniref:FAD-dependent tricarballylate dehydrogenase TcuA n=1 Tax=Kocuria sp. TGY1127_2 TaxID=2711328 RepID=UPI0015BAE090|nr:FAD-dependent tricarballylate dehydrogenase TcuA [Kocuria sp. TGY1127_2]
MSGTEQKYEADVIVVGGGNAGFTAAHAAAKNGRRVLLLEKGPSDDSGGNSFYTAGATRITHQGLEDLKDFIEPDARHAMTTVPPYTSEDYAADLDRVTEGRNDKELTKVLLDEVTETLRWLHSLGLKYRLMYERQSYQNPDGTYLFWGGLHVGNVGGGQGLMADHTRVAGELGIEIQYGVRGKELLTEDGSVIGVMAEVAGKEINYSAESVILTAGGFEADPEMRSQYLGQRWGHAKVRGTPYNTGDMLNAALAVGAARGGDWSSCHSVQWDAFTPHNESNRELTNRLTRQSYPLGILVNKNGDRFLDEGADFRNYTYAKYGKRILEQPDALAFQIFDAKTRPMLREEEYEMPEISEVTAETVGELAEKLGIDPTQLQKTVSDFNSRINVDADFDPNVKDGRRADVEPPKSNWAEEIDTAPFYAYPVTCGITFTFGGLKTDTHGRVLDQRGQHIKGLYAAGEMLGGLFANNYPGGSGLAAGCVFGRRAGQIA